MLASKVGKTGGRDEVVGAGGLGGSALVGVGNAIAWVGVAVTSWSIYDLRRLRAAVLAGLPPCYIVTMVLRISINSGVRVVSKRRAVALYVTHILLYYYYVVRSKR